MSTRSIVLAVTIVATITLGYYLKRDLTAPLVAAPPAQVATPAVLAQAAPGAIIDSPQEQSSNVARSSAFAPTGTTAVIGETKVPLRIQRMPPPPERGGLEDGVAAGFEGFADAARAGDASAARSLYQALDNCRGFPKTRAEYDARVEQSRKAYAQTGGVLAPGEKPQDWNTTVQFLDRWFHRCEGVTQEMYTMAIGLLRESVEIGGDGADANRFVYARAIASTDPKEARAQYDILWEKGYLLALGGLSDSLAHRIAWLAASIAYLHTPPEELSALEASTSPSEFQDASKEAARILQNPRCCKL
jgi:hypothetical protein